MKELDSNSDLQSLKLQIQQIIDMYNNFSKDEQICLTVTEKKQDNNKVNSSEKIDVSKLFICNYGTKVFVSGTTLAGDFDSIGLFEKAPDVCEKKEIGTGLCKPIKEHTVQVYLGRDSDQIAIFKNGQPHFEAQGYPVTLSDGSQVSATCVIGKAYSFESMRLRVYQAGKIGPYEIGKATNKEILEVLAYAQEIFSKENTKQHTKRK